MKSEPDDSLLWLKANERNQRKSVLLLETADHPTLQFRVNRKFFTERYKRMRYDARLSWVETQKRILPSGYWMPTIAQQMEFMLHLYSNKPLYDERGKLVTGEVRERIQADYYHDQDNTNRTSEYLDGKFCFDKGKLSLFTDHRLKNNRLVPLTKKTLEECLIDKHPERAMSLEWKLHKSTINRQGLPIKPKRELSGIAMEFYPPKSQSYLFA